ncbi:MAG: 50S ribosomal protein L4 [Patescibacteria group bacterium]|nr:50S ribosomal protein L4 [Patescibacteria group bacterium]
MIKYQILDKEGKVTGDYELKASIFGVDMNSALIHQAVVAQQANERKVIADTKDRSEVSGGGKKPWKQKGTGRARVGSSRSPIWRGGGIVFGPTNDRNFKLDLNKKMGRKAMFIALSDKVVSKNLALLDKLEMAEFKTKEFIKVVENISKAAWEKKGKSTLIINTANSEQSKASARNLPNVKLINLDNINLVDLIQHENLILTIDAVKALEARYN